MMMRTIALASLLALFVLPACSTAPVESQTALEPGKSAATPVGAQMPRYSIEQFMDTERLAGASFAPGGNRLIYSSNRSGVFNIYAQDLQGGDPIALTESDDDAIYVIRYFPHDERLLYRSDRGGNEITHIYLRELDGSVRDLTPGDQVKAVYEGFSGDGSRLWISTNERDPRFFDLYEYDTKSLARQRVFENDTGAAISTISPDGRYIALNRVRTRKSTEILLFDRERGSTEVLVSDADEVANAPASFSSDSKALYYGSDRGHEFRQLFRRELASAEEQLVLRLDWDVVSASRSQGGRYLVVAVNEDARTSIRLLDARDHSPVQLPELPAGNLNQLVFSADDSRIALYVNDSRIPSDLYLVDFDGSAPRALTRALNPAIDPQHLVDGEVRRFRSYDGLEVPGILYRPHGASADAPVAALVRVHGGPGGQARIGYSGQNQYLIQGGYAIFDINNRGSSGYGKSFYAADDRCHGECDLGDVVASRQFLIDQGWVDPERIGIIGGSYGGYMVLAAMAFEPEAFKVGVNIFGVANWIRTLESIPPWWEFQRQALYAEMGDPAVDGERLRRISPLFHASNIRRPLMVLQGANDPRVLQIESDEIVAAVRANGVPVEYVVFPDEGHGFVKRENEIHAYRSIRNFLDQYLGSAE